MKHLLGYLVGLVGGRSARDPLESLCDEIGCPVERGRAGRYMLLFPGGFGGTRVVMAYWGDGTCDFSATSMYGVSEIDFPAEEFAAWRTAHADLTDLRWRLVDGRTEGEPAMELTCSAATSSLDAAGLRSACEALSEGTSLVDGVGFIRMVKSWV